MGFEICVYREKQKALTAHSLQKYSCPVMAVLSLDVCRLLFVHYDCERKRKKSIRQEVFIFQLNYVNPVHQTYQFSENN